MTGGIALLNMVIGEVIFGGVGVGLCTLVLFTMLTLFLSGLMVGRTPEYQGKKIEKREMQWIVASFLLPSALILIGAGVSAMLPSALASRSHEGPHGLTEILYAFASAAQNNGSSFAGLNANTNYFNLILGVIFMLGRIAVILPSLAIAGLMAKKNYTAPTIGTLSTDTLLFGLLLACIIMIMGALTFLPALALGPILEHFIVQGGA
jgi:K+-transporting ATPase ATPase A chain